MNKVKTQPTEWEKNFKPYTDKELLSTIDEDK